MTHDDSRRSFLVKLAMAGGAVALGACSKSTAAPNCDDLSALSEQQKATRSALKYVAKSTEANKNCANCKLYKRPVDANSCGGCTLFPGPVDAAGYCLGWQAA